MADEMKSLAEDDESEEGIPISNRLFWLLILGIVLVFVGIIVLVVIASIFGGSSSAGVVVFIGPIPIVFGSGPNATWLILIGIILSVISLVLFFVMNRRRG
ncbi:MAG TPA: DUF131 domain-containing protein [Candidatus Acidoferrales bacterium]|nr:DUF131 domain-containing protein [Candidatus Acidoferrales bacterium]